MSNRSLRVHSVGWDTLTSIQNVVIYVWVQADTKISLISLHVPLMLKRTTILREGVTSPRASILLAEPRRPPHLTGPSIAYNPSRAQSAPWRSPLLLPFPR